MEEMVSFIPGPLVSPVAMAETVGAEVGFGTKRSEEHTSELQSLRHLVCRLLLEKKYVGFFSEPISTLFPNTTLFRSSFIPGPLVSPVAMAETVGAEVGFGTK